MKNWNKLNVQELGQKEEMACNGGIFPEGSFLDSFFTAVSSGYRDFKAFLRGEQ